MHKRFFLISFIPALAYWYLESKYPIRIAVSAGMALALLELLFEKIFTGHTHALSKFNCFLIGFLGAIAFIGDQGIWFELQPAFTGVGIGGYLFFRMLCGRSLLIEMANSLGQKLPPEFLIKSMERDVALLFFLYGIFMAFVAFMGTADQWLFFKTIGFYACAAVFMVLEIILSRFRVRREAARIQKEKMLAKFRY